MMFIDIHGHAFRRPWPWQNGIPSFSMPEQLIKRYDQIGIERAVLLPIVNPEVYLPQSNEDILEIVETHPKRFVPFCNIDPRALTNDVNAPLGDILRYYRDCGCKGIGEVMPNLPFIHPLVQNLFKHVEDVGFPLIFDISDRIGGDYGLYDDQGLPQLQFCLERFPKLNILGHGPAFWSEIGQLELPGDRAQYPNYPIKEEGVVPKLMRKFPNLYGDLSASSGYNALARDPGYAIKFINEFQDRLLFGTDICNCDQPAPLAGFLLEIRKSNQISEDVFQNIARENAIRLLGLE